MDKKTNAYVVLLQAGQEMRMLPVFAGPFEAGAVSLAIEHVHSPRPLVHDLLKAVIDNLEGRVDRVEILGMEADYYVACIELITPEGRRVRVDARPSDAVALALRSSAPIFIADEVMAHSGVLLKQEDSDQAAETAEPGDQSPLSETSPEEWKGIDRLGARLRWLVREEAYEAAAEVRDLIRDAGQDKSDHQRCMDMP